MLLLFRRHVFVSAQPVARVARLLRLNVLLGWTILLRTTLLRVCLLDVLRRRGTRLPPLRNGVRRVFLREAGRRERYRNSQGD